MEIIPKKLSEISPDPNQPRQHITPRLVDEMAVSIKNEGVINAIEIDKNNMIVTGELRWRAAEKAGLETIPCKMIEINKNERFIRQMQENIHHNTMSGWDTAIGLSTTLKILPIPAAGMKSSKRFTKHVEYLSKLYGKSTTWVSDSLRLLTERQEVIRKALKTPGFPYTKIIEANNVPDKYKDALKAKVVEQDYIPRDIIRAISGGIRRAEMMGNKEAIKELLEDDYKDDKGNVMTVREAIIKVHEIMPDTQQILEKDIDRVKAITRIATDLGNILKENKLSSVNEPLSKMSLVFQLGILVLIVEKYLKSQMFVKQLEDSKEDSVKLLKGKQS